MRSVRLAASARALGGRGPAFATATPAPPAEPADFVTKLFATQQAKLRALIDGAASIPVPLDGSDAGVAKFQAAHEALRKKVGVLSPDERLAAAVAAARSASPSVRAFLASAAELRAGADLPDTLGADGALNAALDAVEKAAGGAPLLFSDAKGMASFKAAAKEFAAKAGLAGVTSASLLPASAKEQAAAAVAAIKAAHDQALASAKQSAEL